MAITGALNLSDGILVAEIVGSSSRFELRRASKTVLQFLRITNTKKYTGSGVDVNSPLVVTSHSPRFETYAFAMPAGYNGYSVTHGISFTSINNRLHTLRPAMLIAIRSSQLRCSRRVTQRTFSGIHKTSTLIVHRDHHSSTIMSPLLIDDRLVTLFRWANNVFHTCNSEIHNYMRWQPLDLTLSYISTNHASVNKWTDFYAIAWSIDLFPVKLDRTHIYSGGVELRRR